MANVPLEGPKNTPRKMSEPKDRQNDPGRDEVERDIATLTPGDLRKKYNRESNSHKNMKTLCRKGRAQYAPEWEEFAAFLRDMGPRPHPKSKYSLDRVDNENPLYAPGLARWADKKTQTANRSNSRTVRFHGEAMTLEAFAALVGLPYTTVWTALNRGDTPEQIAERAAKREHRQAMGVKAGGWSHPDPERDGEYRRRFRSWKDRLRPAFRKYGYVDVFHYLECTKVWRDICAEYSKESHASDGEMTDALAALERRKSFVEQRREYAMYYIKARDPALAEELASSRLEERVHILDRGAFSLAEWSRMNAAGQGASGEYDE